MLWLGPSLADPYPLPPGKPLTMSLACKSKTLSASVFDPNLVQSLRKVIAPWSHLWVVSQGKHLLLYPQVQVRWGSWSRHLCGFWYHLMWLKKISVEAIRLCSEQRRLWDPPGWQLYRWEHFGLYLSKSLSFLKMQAHSWLPTDPYTHTHVHAHTHTHTHSQQLLHIQWSTSCVEDDLN